MDSGLMYRVYQNQGQGSIILTVTSLHRFYNLLLIRSFVTLFSRTVSITKLKPGTHIDSGPMYCVYQIQGQRLITLGVKSLAGFTICHKGKKIITDFSGTMKAIELKLGKQVASGLMYHVYQNQGQEPITLGVTSIDSFRICH